MPESGVHLGRCLTPPALFLKTWLHQLLHPEASEWRPSELVPIALDPFQWYLDERRRWTVPRLATKIDAAAKWAPWLVRANPDRFPYLFPSRFPASALEYYVQPGGTQEQTPRWRRPAGQESAGGTPLETHPQALATWPATAGKRGMAALRPGGGPARRGAGHQRFVRHGVHAAKVARAGKGKGRGRGALGRQVPQRHSPPSLVAGCTGSAPTANTPFRRPPRSTGASRCIYVDIGANHADTFDLFTRGTHFNDAAAFSTDATKPSPCPHVPSRANVESYLVEANPMHDAVLIDRFCRYPQLRGLYNRTAMWNASKGVAEGGIKFYLDLVNGNEQTWPFAWSASTNPHGHDIKRSGYQHIVVPTLDVCELLLREVEAEPSNRVVVKIDIEDADEVLLRRILSTPACLRVVDVIAFEDAARKPERRSAESIRIEEQFKAAGVVVRGWS